MSETALERFERQQASARANAEALTWLLHNGPLDPQATPEEVLTVACRVCGAEPGAPCDTRWPRPSFASFVRLPGIHLRRYLDKTGDPR